MATINDALMAMAEAKVLELSRLVHDASNALTGKQLEISQMRRELAEAERQYNDGVMLLNDARETLIELRAMVTAMVTDDIRKG